MTAAEQVTPGPARLTTSVVRELSHLEALVPEWRELNEKARAGCLFLGPEWLMPWWKHFGGGRALRVICVRDGHQLVGLLPLFLETVRYGGVPARRLAFLGDGATGCDYLDLIADPGGEMEVLEAALGQLSALDWDVCDLDGLWRESPTALQLSQRFPAGRASGGVVRDGRLRYVCPHIPLRGSWEQYLDGLGRKENLKRREKWLGRQPGVSIVCGRTVEEAVKGCDEFLGLHRARWAVDGGSDGLADERHENFHRDAVKLLAGRGWLRMYTLYAARRPVASVYGVVHRGKFLYYQSGFDPAWGNKSVGLVLLARTVQDAYAEGLREFDFLRGNEGYKAEWSRGERWTIQLRLWRGVRGRLARAGHEATLFGRETVKAALPKDAIETVKKARRLLRAPRVDGETHVEAALRLLR